VRQLLVFDNFSGRYGGAMHTDTAGCRDPALNGVAENLGVINITQSGRSIALAVSPAAGGTCSYSGTLIQAGQLGTVTGSYVCTGGDAGAFELFELQGNITGVTGRFASTSNTFPGCRDAGWLGGVRVTTF